MEIILVLEGKLWESVAEKENKWKPISFCDYMVSDGWNQHLNSELIFVAHFPPAGFDSKHLSLTDRHMNTLAVILLFVCLSPPCTFPDY